MSLRSLLRPRFLIWLLLPGLLWWAWQDIPFDQVANSLQELTIWQILIVIVLNAVLAILFCVRWWLILRVIGFKLPLLKLSMYRIASFAISFLTPGPQFGGEPIQMLALIKRHQIPHPEAVASVVLDKILELLSNFTFLAIGICVVFLTGIFTDPSVLQMGFSAVGMVLLPISYVLLLSSNRKPISSILLHVHKLVSIKFVSLQLISTIDSAEALAGKFCKTKPVQFLLIFIISLAVWILTVFELWLMFNFLGLVLSLPQIIFVIVAARIALLFPLPGGLGVLEASQVLALEFLGLNQAVGVGVILLVRGRDLITSVFGLIVSFFISRPIRDNEFLPEKKNLITHTRSGGL